jgi:lysozyme family protein
VELGPSPLPFSDARWRIQTKAAVERAIARDPDDLDIAAELHAQRLYFMAGLSTWKTFGLGWSRRLAKLPLQAGHHWPSDAA